jgi:hypothetical protein
MVPLMLDNTKILNVTGDSNVGSGWTDSYSVDNACYCSSTFDHNIGSVKVHTPMGIKTVKEVCDIMGPGPGKNNRPVYNDIQCGNGPPNDAGDETICPGRTDHGKNGCKYIGPKWKFNKDGTKNPTPAPIPASTEPINGFWQMILDWVRKLLDWLQSRQ